MDGKQSEGICRGRRRRIIEKNSFSEITSERWQIAIKCPECSDHLLIETVRNWGVDNKKYKFCPSCGHRERIKRTLKSGKLK